MVRFGEFSMSQDLPIVLPHGGFKKLLVYRKSQIIYQGTVLFCQRFLPAYGDRTVDQMVQAARSCKQNIAEGSAASGTSKETEIKLTNVARATLDELQEDYLDWLEAHGFGEWSLDDERKVAARSFAKAHPDWEDWQEIFNSRPPEVCCNLMIVIILQTKYLLDQMLKRQEEDFKQHGGVRERMHAARTAARGEAWDKELYSKLSATKNAEDLAMAVTAIKHKVDALAQSIARKRGWRP
jgi:four helix bundle suffix protein